MAAERLQKYLARAGVASRRHAEELITAGRVQVNNKTVTELGSRVEPGTDLVSVDGKLVSPPESTSYFLLYKPAGVVTTLSDPQGRPTVASYVEGAGTRLFPVGRLDYDAEGALLFTDDGALAHKLTHPSFQVPRTYLAKVKGSPDAATLDKLRGGVRLEDGMATPLSVDVFEQAERNTWLKIVVAEGRPHLIKRLCAAVGHPVVRLYRPAYAGVKVSGLRPGEMRPLTSAEVRLLQDVAEARMAPPEGDLGLPPRRHGRSAPGHEAAEDSGDDFETEEKERPEPVVVRMPRKPEEPGTGAPRRGAAERAPRGAGSRTRTEGGTGLARFGRSRPDARGAQGDRPQRKTWQARGDEGERPQRREWKPRDEGDRPARKEWKPRGEGAGRPERREWKPRGEGAGRPERREWKPRGEGAERPERREWKPRGEGAERPQRREWKPRDEGDRPARKEWKPRGEGAGRPERREWKPRGEGAERPERREWKPRGEGAGRPERREWKPRGEGGDRPARKEWKPRGEAAGRSARKEWAPRGEGAGRPERREWKPRGDGGDRPARKEWSPRGEGAGAAPRGRGAGAFGRPARSGGPGGGARPERRSARPEGGEEGGGGFVDWRKRKKREPGAAWDSHRPPPGGKGRGPRKPGGPRRPR
jgi:23S rRNA pseudouridine2605 synthase